jgi:hypothetical protein
MEESTRNRKVNVAPSMVVVISPLRSLTRKGVSGAVRLLVCRLPDRCRTGLLRSLQRGMMLVRKRFEIDEKSLGWLRDTCQGESPDP